MAVSWATSQLSTAASSAAAQTRLRGAVLVWHGSAERAQGIASSSSAEGARLRELAGGGGALRPLRLSRISRGRQGHRQEVERAAEYLARAMGSLVAVLDPEVFVIGGGLSELARGFWTPSLGTLQPSYRPKDLGPRQTLCLPTLQMRPE